MYVNDLLSIGIAAPQAKLHVASGSTSTGNILQKYFSIILNDGNSITQTLTDVCAIFESSVWCKQRFSTSSDERIKTNIQDITLQKYRYNQKHMNILIK